MIGYERAMKSFEMTIINPWKEIVHARIVLGTAVLKSCKLPIELFGLSIRDTFKPAMPIYSIYCDLAF